MSPLRPESFFARRMVPLAAAVAIAVGVLWWFITLRQLSAPALTVRDGERTITLASNGHTQALRDLPVEMQAVVWETLRSGKVAIAPPEGSGDVASLSEARRVELQEWTRRAGDSHLALGIVKARAGLLDEARREFELLARDNPDSPLVRRLLEQVTRP